ncbi:STAS domain-containing protein [Streptomyces sp. APSN-46.1]|uniref:STAS domain-containing protein n=1 Tax=Streptomyces sp. APSN-46.1 TaxID=2929049 RepID=UPI001FB1FE1C|nr:STAS domain-containing protein [Streptomyces sp. APSN-46.1]MCJ1676473.1 STAS domain-containing protein [Streptomyces sp. APSN-46.1]
MAVDAYGTADGGAGPRFTADMRWSGRTAVVVLAGELDHDNPEPLREALATSLEQGAERIVVDCGRLTFCDSTGLNILLKGRLDACQAGSSLELAALPPMVARMFDITGAKAVFTVHTGLQDALSEEQERP